MREIFFIHYWRHETIGDIFLKYDLNQDGFITPNEIVQVDKIKKTKKIIINQLHHFDNEFFHL